MLVLVTVYVGCLSGVINDDDDDDISTVPNAVTRGMFQVFEM